MREYLLGKLRKNNFFLYTIVIFANYIVLNSCKKDDKINSTEDCVSFVIAPPRHLFAPDSVKADSTIEVNIIYNNQRACQNFNGFSESIMNNVRNISLITKIDSCNCSSNYNIQSLNYQFSTSNIGEQIIRINVSDSIFLVDTVFVY